MSLPFFTLFFFNDTAPTEIYTLSLHDALPISPLRRAGYGYVETPVFEETAVFSRGVGESTDVVTKEMYTFDGSEEHTSELQSPYDLVCRLLLEKKKNQKKTNNIMHI